MKNKFYSVVILFAQCEESEAREILAKCVKLFEPKVSHIEFSSYYKFENSYELSFWVEQNNITPDQALKQVGDKIGEGWIYHFMDDPDYYTSFAIWNETANNILLSDKVFFANLETSNPIE